jgi:7-dehydrocholesterol reductase
MEIAQHAAETSTARRLRWCYQRVLVPLMLLTCCPIFAMVMWYTNASLDGSISQLWTFVQQHGGVESLRMIWGPYLAGTGTAWAMIGVFALFQLALMRLLPGKEFRGPATPSGHVPIYKDNGLLAYVVTAATFFLLSYGLELFSPSIVYDNFPGLIGALNLFSLLFCGFLYLKGRFAPSPGDHGTSGNFIFDFYWGTELYPRVAGFDLKQFTNCRFGMMAWPIILFSFAAKQQELFGLSDAMVVAIAIQLVYLTKFYIWETGYLASLDIMHDRAGFYICWGCLVWVPSIYTSPSLFLVNHPNHLGVPLAVAIGLCGAAAVLCNFWADRQRQRVRATNGQCTVWGRPPQLIEAHYRNAQGEPKMSLLLTSGWWGISRHFHYLLEIAGAFLWTVPALFTHSLPYFYVVFLILLLVHRAMRDEDRCSAKYGLDWERYRRAVPYQMIPGIF